MSFMTHQATESKISIYNNTGQLVNSHSMAVMPGHNKIKFDCIGLPKGAYTYTIACGNSLTHTGKLVKI